MTVSSIINKIIYTGNGSTTAFPTTFPFFDAAEIEVVERVIATGAETVKTLTTHYTVSGGAGATGTVTAVTAPASTVQWVIRRVTAKTQEIDYVENDPFPAATHEEGLDRAAMRIIDMAEAVDRAPKFPVSDPSSAVGDLPSSVDRLGKFLYFNATTGVPEAAATTDTIVSVFMATVLDDADGDAALATLGFSAFMYGLKATASAAALRTAAGLVIGTDVLGPAVTATLTVGNKFTPYDAGTKSTGTFTPDAANGNYQYYINGGAHTLAAPAADSAMDILVTNNATAGAITFSGFTVSASVGDALTTTDTEKFIISIRRINSVATYVIKALQ